MKRLLPLSLMAAAIVAITLLASCYNPPENKTASTPAPAASTEANAAVKIVRLDPAFDKLVPADAKVEKLVDGHQWTEGPVWNRKEGYLLFSDIPNNAIIKWQEGKGESVFLKPAGYTGKEPFTGREPGTNGLTYDSEGRLVACEHGDRRVSRLEADGKTKTTLADKYNGKRLNSPNDLVYRSDGALFFTDPPFGLPKFGDDPRKELKFSGVYSIYKGKLQLINTDFAGPNGIALSPDEKYLYVGNWDEKKKVVMRYEITADAKLSNGRLFFDMTNAPGEDAIDGVKVDQRGNVYVSGPGGLWVISAEGKHLGTIIAPKHVHNMAWGDDDGKTLYLCARSGLYRMRLNVAGAQPAMAMR